MRIRNHVDLQLTYRPELTPEDHMYLIEWAVSKRCPYYGRIRARGTDPNLPSSTFWELVGRIRITLWPSEQRVWATHEQRPSDDEARILRYLAEVLATHPATRH